MQELIFEYYKLRNEVDKITWIEDGLHDAIMYDSDGYAEDFENGDLTEEDTKKLKTNIKALKQIIEGFKQLNFKYG